MKKQKQRVGQTIDSVEVLKNFPGELGKYAAQEGKKAVFDMWEQILNPNSKADQKKQFGDLKPGEELNLKEEKKEVRIVENIPTKAGKYDINFIEWVLAMIRSAQKRVESAVSWTAALQGKRN